MKKKKKECADPFTNESWACCFMLSKERIELCFSKGLEPDGRGVTPDATFAFKATSFGENGLTPKPQNHSNNAVNITKI